MTNLTELLKKSKGKPFNYSLGMSEDNTYGDTYSQLQYMSPEKIEEALEVAVEEIKQEVLPEEPVEVEEVIETPEEPEQEDSMRMLVDELKSVLVDGLGDLLEVNTNNVVPELLARQNDTLKQIADKPVPEVKAPEINPVVRVNTPKIDPIKTIKAVNISRDARGNINGVEFEVTR